MLRNFTLFNQSLKEIKQTRALINTLNAHSFNTLQTDEDFQNAIQSSDILLPDGISVVLAMRLLTGERLKKIAGVDLFHYEMDRLNTIGGKCFFLGSSESTLQLMLLKAAKEYPCIKLACYSPPYKPEFTAEDNLAMIEAVNGFEPDVLFVGMTAPKQEKWAYKHFSTLKVGHLCCIGAVFDFYAGTVKRSPQWMISLGMEWFYRLIKEPRRMWKRYLIGNIKFVLLIMQEKIVLKKNGRHSYQK
ncbi:MAG: WecB/TagA/CpsF family glycosyltransferase [Paludibacter sp.]